MKEKKIAIMAWAVMLSASVFADVNYNGAVTLNTAIVTEDVYIGTSTEEGSVTVQDDAVWTVKANIFLGFNSKTNSLVVEKGATLTMNDNNTRYLFVGASNGAHGVVTNNGTMNLSHIQLAPYAHADKDSTDDNLGKNYRSGRFDNFGDVLVKRNLTLGAWKDDYGEMSDVAVFHNHTNATLTIERADEFGFYIGGRSSGKMVNEGTITCPKNLKVRIGGALTSGGTGKLLQTTNATFYSSGEVRIGENKGKGEIELYDNSVFSGGVNSTDVFVGYSISTEGRITLANDSQFNCDLLYLGKGDSSKAVLSMHDNATLSFSGSNLGVALGKASEGCLELVDYEKTSFNKNVYLGIGTNSVGVFRLDGDTALTYDKTFRLGCNNSSTGRIEVAGNSSLTIPKNFTVGAYTNINAFGELNVSGDAVFTVNGNLSVGTENTKPGKLTVCERGIVSVTNLSVAAKWGGSNQDGTLVVADSSVIKDLCLLRFGRGTTANGKCFMRGGTISLAAVAEADSSPLVIGINGDTTAGYLEGWGTIRFDNPKSIMQEYTSLGRKNWGGFYLYGKVIADGLGEMRDLDFSRAGVCNNSSTALNSVYTNGWYAVNKGRLIMSRSLPRATKDHATIGDHPTLPDPRLVNSFRYDFDKNTMDKTDTYVFSELYAVNRDDIPAGLPTGKGIHHSAVWRIGHFNASATPDVDDEDLTADHKQNFTSLKLKFHYDPALAEIEGVRHVKVYRCTDSDNGGWTCVASITAPDSASPYIETVEMAPSSELWNGGWFAIVGTPRVGTVMVVR